jgi:hypothetical protein
MKKFISILLIAMTLLSLAACQSGDPATTAATGGNKEPKELVLADTYTAITANVTMPEMMLLDDADTVLGVCGINIEHTKQLQVWLCANSLRADEIWLIEATDAEALAQLKQAAQNRLTAKDEESITYDPEQNAIVKKAHLATYGNYLVMIVSPDVETITAAFKTEAGV